MTCHAWVERYVECEGGEMERRVTCGCRDGPCVGVKNVTCGCREWREVLRVRKDNIETCHV